MTDSTAEPHRLPTADDLRKVRYPNGVALAPRTYTSPERDRLTREWPNVIGAIGQGQPLRPILEQISVQWQVFYDLLADSPAHAESYARAREARADHWHARAEDTADRLLNGDNALQANAAGVALRGIEWITKVLDPKKYGDSKHVTVDVTHRLPADELDDEQLARIARRQAAIDTTATPVDTAHDGQIDGAK